MSWPKIAHNAAEPILRTSLPQGELFELDFIAQSLALFICRACQDTGSPLRAGLRLLQLAINHSFPPTPFPAGMELAPGQIEHIIEQLTSAELNDLCQMGVVIERLGAMITRYKREPNVAPSFWAPFLGIRDLLNKELLPEPGPPAAEPDGGKSA